MVLKVKKLFGIKLHHREFFEALPELVSEIFKGHINWYDFAMGMVCMALLKGLQILKQKKENDESLSPVLRKGNSSGSTKVDQGRSGSIDVLILTLF